MAVAGNNGAAWPRGAGYGPDGTYLGPPAPEKNTLGQLPFFFHRLLRLVAARRFDITPTERILAPGFVRRWWLRDPNSDWFGMQPFSWTRNSFSDNQRINGIVSTGVGRYMTTATIQQTQGGNQLSNPEDRLEIGFVRSAGQPPLIRAGQKKNNPTIRSRITSFGSRVPPVNNPYPSEQVPGA